MQSIPPALLYCGQTLRLLPLADGFVELRFDRRDGAVNMFDQRTVAELDAARRALAQLEWLKGILVTSAKDVFIVGADITEFTQVFAQPRPQLLDYLRRSNEVFVRFEALDVPSVAAINGFALGGGLEFALVASHRVMAAGARIGVPEVGLGLIPGLGGTVRLPRVAGLEHALAWITDGEARDAPSALGCGVVDRVCAAQDLRAEATALLRTASADWQARRERKRTPLALGSDALQAIVDARSAAIARDVPAWLPAAARACELVARSAAMDAPAALEAEAQAFATLAQSAVAMALVRNFINQQAVRRLARQLARATAAAAEPAWPRDDPPVAHASPLPGATLLEIASTHRTDAAALARLAAEALQAGKVPLRVRAGGPGVIRRVHAACVRACQPLLQAGMLPSEIDQALQAAGWTVGPFAAAALLDPTAAAAQDPEAQGAVQRGTQQAPVDGESIVRRVLVAAICEAAGILDEGVVGTAAELDTALLLGLGFPRHLGGPLHHADRIGPAQACALADTLGLTVPASLKARIGGPEGFYAAA